MNRHTNIKQIYAQYSQRLYFTSLRIVGNSFDAEEIMQDTILKYHNLSGKESILEPGKWLTSVCIRKSIDKLREKHRNKDFLEEYKEIQSIEQSPTSTPGNCSIEDIKKALLLLPDSYRTILSLHLFEGYDYQEIEQITGTKEVTLRSLYKRAKDKLAATLQNTKR